MNLGKFVFAQVMEHLPLHVFHRCVVRYSGRAQGQVVLLSRPVPLHGLRAADLSREPARHRSVSACAKLQALSPGISQLHCAQHAGQCQRDAGLAHLLRLRTKPDRHRPATLRRRGARARSQGHRLRARCHHDRSVSLGLSLGAIPLDQGGGQAAHALGFAGQYPSFIFISDGKLHDVNILDQLVPEPGAIYVMDRGYIDFDRLGRFHETGSFFVIRAKTNLKAERRYSHAVDRSTGLVCDQTVTLAGFYSHKGFPAPLRRIRFKDPETGKRLIFLSNNFALPALTITKLYRLRWQIELFFKWIKQHLRIKAFFGTTENAVKTQIWIAVSVSVLVAIVKKRLQLSASLYEILQILSLTMFERMPIDQLLSLQPIVVTEAVSPNQLRWSRLSKQDLRFDRWSICQG